MGRNPEKSILIAMESISNIPRNFADRVKKCRIAWSQLRACGFTRCLKINIGEPDGEFPASMCRCACSIWDRLGSAVKTAQMLNVDNRIMYRIGVVARRLKMIDADFVMGIPLSVSGKNIYFDR